MASRIRLVPVLALVAAALAGCSSSGNTTGPGNGGGGPPTGPSFNLQFPAQGTSQSFAFADTGSWVYHCAAHGTQTSGMHATVVVTATAAAESDTVEVGVPSLQFTPASVTIKPGGTVRWINRSSMVNHTVTRP